MAKLTAFTIRVYGILLDEMNGVLVSDELEYGMCFTKFPGGGLELGEGTKDCLVREWKEELGQEITIADHLYTTDFFQPSAFHTDKQVISIYYLVKALDRPLVRISESAFDFVDEKEPAQSFRWISWRDFSEADVTFPIDKLVAGMILAQKKKQ